MTDYQSLFNRDFYPTPSDVIRQMLSVSDISGKIILEPSAGQGNIVDYLQKNGAKQVIACEINDKLRKVVAAKCDVIESDFLQLHSDKVSHIDMIVMNPPFSKAVEHIIHAWEIAPDGCEIISLCNSETLDYTHRWSKNRELQELISLYGGSEGLGDAFKTGERATDVWVSVVRLYKPAKGEFEFASYFTDEADEPELVGNGMIKYDFVRDCVNRYTAAVSKFDAVMTASREINDLTKGLGGCDIYFGAHNKNENGGNEVTRDYFKKELQKSAWKWLFQKFNLERFTTKKVMDEINKFVELQQNVPFTMKNIYKMVGMIYASGQDIINQALCDAFDTICSFSADNSTAGEKWRTNSNYMVNKRFIVPCLCEPSWQGYVSLTYSWEYTQKVDDIYKVLCFLMGVKHDSELELRNFIYKKQLKFGELYEWGFFKIRCYKKGTVHFEFIDDEVWYKFNQTVVKSRGWNLPQTTHNNRRKNK